LEDRPVARKPHTLIPARKEADVVSWRRFFTLTVSLKKATELFSLIWLLAGEFYQRQDLNYRIDLFAIFIFLGIVQATVLSCFFLSGRNRKVQANLFQGIFLLSMAANNVEILLMYTGYILGCLYLVDFSEPIAFIIGPSFYLMIVSLIKGSVRRWDFLHFVFPVIYFFLQLPFLIQSDDVKYNAWIYAYHPGMLPRDTHLSYDPRFFWVTNHHTEMVLLSLFGYGMAGLFLVIRAFRKENESIWRTKNPVLKKIRNGMIQVMSSLLLIIVVKLFNRKDTGDHLFAAYISIIIYLTSFRVIGNSGFFKQPSLHQPQKYKTSSITSGQQEEILVRLKEMMDREKPFTQPDFSLPELAAKLHLSVHQLSQVINVGLQKNFFELTAEYRVAEAMQLLKDKPRIKVDEIAFLVGYNSKSSFNTTFKKQTGKTPSEYRALVQG
jgi:AraC-like DNA-binding protein